MSLIGRLLLSTESGFDAAMPLTMSAGVGGTSGGSGPLLSHFPSIPDSDTFPRQYPLQRLRIRRDRLTSIRLIDTQ